DITVPGTCPGTYSRTKTWQAKDCSGNLSGTVSQTITVVDTTKPSITCPAPVTVLSPTAPASVSLRSPIPSDTCGAVIVTNNARASLPFGTTTVTWTATDCSGNTQTCTQAVTVIPAATITIRSALHTTGGGSGSVKTPLALALKVFDKAVVGSPD